MRHCETVGQLRTALAGMPDDAPLRVEYDGGSGGASSVGVVGVATVATADDAEFDPWARAGDAVLSIDYDLGACENVAHRASRCPVCPLTVWTYTDRETGQVIEDGLRDGLVPPHFTRAGECPGGGQLPVAAGGSL